MGRAKLKMELIPKEKSRRSTFMKRTKGLKKKIHEFSTLCDVDACMILYNEPTNIKQGHGDRQVVEPEIWPHNIYDTHRIINRYHGVDKDDRRKRSLGVTDFFGDQTTKMEDERRLLHENNESLLWNERVNSFTFAKLRQLTYMLDVKREEINARIASVKGRHGNGNGGGTGMVVHTNNMSNDIIGGGGGGSNFHGGGSNFHGTTWVEDDAMLQPPLRCLPPPPSDRYRYHSYDNYGCYNNGGNFPDQRYNNNIMMTENMELLKNVGSLSTFCNYQQLPYQMPAMTSLSLMVDPHQSSSFTFPPNQMMNAGSQMYHQQFNIDSFDVGDDAMINNKYKMDSSRFFHG